MHIVIIGNGIAGISTARHVRKLSDCEITVISGETDYFWSRTALMYIYMGHMKFEHTQPYENHFWEKNRINLRRAWVERVDPSSQVLFLDNGEAIKYDKLVLATGSKPNKFGWPGQDLKGVQGMVSAQDLESMEAYSKDTHHAVIIGGGLIGIEMAEMFHSRHIPVSFLVREKSFWNKVMPAEESAMINREIDRTEGIDLRLGTEMTEILSDENGRARAVITKDGEEIPCQFVGLTAGVSPNLALAESLGVETGRGFKVDEYLETSVPNVYAIGDCAELRDPAAGRRAIEAVWYTGKLMGPVLAKTLTGTPTVYTQSTWFNSAKFLDIEWHTYGTVTAQPAEHEATLYWEHEDGRRSIRIIYHKEEGYVIGFNTMGVRFRADTCLHWLDSQTHIEEVLANLRSAHFDPEFFSSYEKEVLAAYKAQKPGKTIELAPINVGKLGRSIAILMAIAAVLMLAPMAIAEPVLKGILQGVGGFFMMVGLVRAIELLYTGFSKGFNRLSFR